MSDHHQILCGRCKVPLKGPGDSNPQSRFSFPQCGTGDTRENVLREVGEQVKEQAARHLQEIMRRAACGSSILQFKGNPIPKRTYRFTTDVEFR